MLWILPALATLGAQCLVANWNRTHQYATLNLNFWRVMVSIFTLSPVVLLPDWPENEAFYYTSIVIGIGSALAAMVTFHLASKYNGRVSLISSNIAMIITFISWILIDETTQNELMSAPLKSAGIGLLLIIAFIAILKMRDSKRETQGGYIAISIAMGITIAATTIIGKLNLPNDPTSEMGTQVLIMGLIIFLTQLFFTTFIIVYRKTFKNHGSLNFKKHLNWNVFYLGLLGSFGCITSWAAIALTPNPAFVTAILMTAPLLFLVYHKLKGIEDKANPGAGAVLAICVTLIILMQ